MQEDGVLSEVFRVVALIHLVPQPLYHSHYTPSKPARARPGYQILTNPDSLNFPISGFGRVDADLSPIWVTLGWRNIMSTDAHMGQIYQEGYYVRKCLIFVNFEQGLLKTAQSWDVQIFPIFLVSFATARKHWLGYFSLHIM